MNGLGGCGGGRLLCCGLGGLADANQPAGGLHSGGYFRESSRW